MHHITTNLTVWPLLRLARSRQSQWYPMHMRLNGASKTLIQLIDGVFPIFDLIQCKNMVPRQQSDRFSAPEPPTTSAPPQNQPAESADEVDCVALRWPLWMAAPHRWMREVDGSPMVALSWGFWPLVQTACPETEVPSRSSKRIKIKSVSVCVSVCLCVWGPKLSIWISVCVCVWCPKLLTKMCQTHKSSYS